MILGKSLATNQKVRCSNHLGRTIKINRLHVALGDFDHHVDHYWTKNLVHFIGPSFFPAGGQVHVDLLGRADGSVPMQLSDGLVWDAGHLLAGGSIGALFPDGFDARALFQGRA
jgi:hypothetical protein